VSDVRFRPLAICDLDACLVPAGTRVRVAGVYEDVAERNGYVKDQQALLGRTGRTRRLTGRDVYAQLAVDWDEPGCSLLLCALDKVEVLVA
jgi:hypothetical protein